MVSCMFCFSSFPGFTDKEHSALVLHLTAIYILNGDAEGGGDGQRDRCSGPFRPRLTRCRQAVQALRRGQNTGMIHGGSGRLWITV